MPHHDKRTQVTIKMQAERNGFNQLKLINLSLGLSLGLSRGGEGQTEEIQRATSLTLSYPARACRKDKIIFLRQIFTFKVNNNLMLRIATTCPR